MGQYDLADDDVEVCVRGKLLSAGLIAEATMSCEASSLSQLSH